MARITYISPINEIVGSIGSTTFQKNQSGTIAKSRPTGKKQSSELQMTSQQNQVGYTHKWLELSYANKVLWNDYAAIYTKINKFGQSKILTGFNWFQSINSNLSLAGLPEVDAPTAHALPVAVPDFNLYLDGIYLQVHFGVTIALTDTMMKIFTSKPIHSINVSNAKKSILTRVEINPNTLYFPIAVQWSNAHKLDYFQLRNTGNFYISCSISLVNTLSGVEGPFLTKLGEFQ